MDKKLIDNIYSYMISNYGIRKEDVDTILTKHKEYDTFVAIDGKGYARFNIEGDTAYILDCIVIEGGVKTIRQLCKLGLEKFPYAINIRFERKLKQRKDMRKFNLNDLIKEVL